MSKLSLQVAAAVLTAAFSQLALAQMSPAQRFELAPDDQPLRGVSLGTQPVTVFLKMAGDPVAVVRSRAPGKQISEPERRSTADSLRREQDAITPAIEAMGGTVVTKLQHAINGIKVRATRDQLASMATLPGVVGIKPVLIYKPVNAVSVPSIGTPAVWGGSPAFHGEHIKLAILDTGADYTHANFGGPGTVAAFDDAFANSTKPANPALFGPNAPKVKGGNGGGVRRQGRRNHVPGDVRREHSQREVPHRARSRAAGGRLRRARLRMRGLHRRRRRGHRLVRGARHADHQHVS